MTTTLINPDEWTTASEAARLLGISSTRVLMLADDGVIDVLRPWPRVALVSMESIRARQAGEQLPRLMTTDARRYVLSRANARSIHELIPSDIEGHLIAFITEARPLWDAERRVGWVEDMQQRLLTTREHTAQSGPGAQTLPRVECPRCGRSVPAQAGAPRRHRDADGIACPGTTAA